MKSDFSIGCHIFVGGDFSTESDFWTGMNVLLAIYWLMESDLTIGNESQPTHHCQAKSLFKSTLQIKQLLPITKSLLHDFLIGSHFFFDLY